MVIIVNTALILAYIFIFLIGVILLISIIPLSYDIFLNIYNSKIQGEVKIKWLKGLIGIKLVLKEVNCYSLILLNRNIYTRNIITKNRSYDKGKTNKKVKNTKRRKIHKKDIEFIEIFKLLKESILRLFHKFKPKYFNIIGIYGFENPAITGALSGITAMLSSITEFNIDIRSTFIEKIIDFKVEIGGEIRIIDLMMIFATTIIKKPIRKLMFCKKEKMKT